MPENVTLLKPQSLDEALGLVLPLLAARETDHDLQGVLAADNLRDASAAGLMGIAVPLSAGGFGADLEGATDALRLIAAASPSTALMMVMHTAVLANYLVPVDAVPTEEREAFLQQRSWAWEQAASGKIFAVANSEPGAAGDVHRSLAFTHANETKLSGVKSFASMGTAADYYMAAAKSSAGNIEYFLVDNDPEHVTVEKSWEAMGMRSSESVMLRFEDATVRGPLCYRGLLDGVNMRHWSTLSFCATFIGIAESLFDELRIQSSSILHKVEMVELHLTLQACRSFLAHCTTEERMQGYDAKAYRRLVRDCKLFVTRSLARQATALFTAQSGAAYRFSAGASRKLRDLLAGPALRPPVGVSFDQLWDEIELATP